MAVPNQSEVLDLFKLIRPWSMRENSKIRIGNDHDGGYVLPACVLQCDAIVSIGVGPDVSFDLVLAERGAKVLQYDHTVDDVPQHHPNFIFHKKGWGARTEGDFIGFDDIFAHLQALQPKRAMLNSTLRAASTKSLRRSNLSIWRSSMSSLASFMVLRNCPTGGFTRAPNAPSKRSMSVTSRCICTPIMHLALFWFRASLRHCCLRSAIYAAIWISSPGFPTIRSPARWIGRIFPASLICA